MNGIDANADAKRETFLFLAHALRLRLNCGEAKAHAQTRAQAEDRANRACATSSFVARFTCVPSVNVKVFASAFAPPVWTGLSCLTAPTKYKLVWILVGMTLVFR